MPKARSRVRSRRGISRIDQDSTRTHGYFVRVGWHRRRDGAYVPQFKAFFGDASHGGKRRALRAASAWLAASMTLLAKAKRKP